MSSTSASPGRRTTRTPPIRDSPGPGCSSVPRFHGTRTGARRAGQFRDRRVLPGCGAGVRGHRPTALRGHGTGRRRGRVTPAGRRSGTRPGRRARRTARPRTGLPAQGAGRAADVRGGVGPGRRRGHRGRRAGLGAVAADALGGTARQARGGAPRPRGRGPGPTAAPEARAPADVRGGRGVGPGGRRGARHGAGERAHEGAAGFGAAPGPVLPPTRGRCTERRAGRDRRSLRRRRPGRTARPGPDRAAPRRPS